jgi:hypothetical protein
MNQPLFPIKNAAGAFELSEALMHQLCIEIIDGIRVNDIPLVEQRFRAVARLPKNYSQKFLERGSIYPEIEPLIKERQEDLIVAVINIARQYQLSTLTLDLCQAAALLQLSSESPSKALLDLLQQIAKNAPDYKSTLATLISESRYPVDEHFQSLQQFLEERAQT